MVACLGVSLLLIVGELANETRTCERWLSSKHFLSACWIMSFEKLRGSIVGWFLGRLDGDWSRGRLREPLRNANMVC